MHPYKDMIEQNKSGILLESGTNEFELLIFKLENCSYGVNVSKVKEIIKYTHITPLVGSDERILGVFMPRDEIITAVDLRKCIYGVDSVPNDKDLFIVCHFNNLTTAFQVDSVSNIMRINWKEIISPNSILNDDTSIITGIIKMNDDIISILDFEALMTSINPDNGLTSANIDEMTDVEIKDIQEQNIKVYVADDSKMLNSLICDAMKKAGFIVDSSFDGLQLYEKIKSKKEKEQLNDIDCIVTDIEMPQMDGLTLCRTLKEDNATKDIPVLMFSSLIDDMMKAKCESVHADGAFSKPEIGNVAEMVTKLVNKRKKD